MRRGFKFHRDERGSTLVEFSIGALVFLTATFGVLEFSRLLWAHNALSDAARRGARYAINHASADEAAVRNVVVYGNPEGAGNPTVHALSTSNVEVEYTASPVTGVFGYPEGTVTVSITGYKHKFVVPGLTKTLSMPAYTTTLTAENAGMIPADITPTPTPSPAPTPSSTPTPSATPSPSPTPTPRACNAGENPSVKGCVCQPPMTVKSNGECQ
ncbi:MAG TPA: TadE/TadG family type IV pilus assembly protein [Pyrinomonadaceae bacterium]|nr:TadE/TadG family type IV pilus assembly protein [Pyrinomonadaceae bacterium]